jgi:predicted RNase H-like nuclease (RuvC/YqgF family)
MSKPKFEDYSDIFSYYDALEVYVEEIEDLALKRKLIIGTDTQVIEDADLRIEEQQETIESLKEKIKEQNSEIRKLKNKLL